MRCSRRWREGEEEEQAELSKVDGDVCQVQPCRVYQQEKTQRTRTAVCSPKQRNNHPRVPPPFGRVSHTSVPFVRLHSGGRGRARDRREVRGGHTSCPGRTAPRPPGQAATCILHGMASPNSSLTKVPRQRIRDRRACFRHPLRLSASCILAFQSFPGERRVACGSYDRGSWAVKPRLHTGGVRKRREPARRYISSSKQAACRE